MEFVFWNDYSVEIKIHIIYLIIDFTRQFDENKTAEKLVVLLILTGNILCRMSGRRAECRPSSFSRRIMENPYLFAAPSSDRLLVKWFPVTHTRTVDIYSCVYVSNLTIYNIYKPSYGKCSLLRSNSTAWTLPS